jgi:hypothetical protein
VTRRMLAPGSFDASIGLVLIKWIHAREKQNHRAARCIDLLLRLACVPPNCTLAKRTSCEIRPSSTTLICSLFSGSRCLTLSRTATTGMAM